MLSKEIMNLRRLISSHCHPSDTVFAGSYDSIFTFEDTEINQASFIILSLHLLKKNTSFVQLSLILPSQNFQGEAAGMQMNQYIEMERGFPPS